MNEILVPYCSILPNADHSNCPSSTECFVVTIEEIRAWRYNNSMAWGR